MTKTGEILKRTEVQYGKYIWKGRRTHLLAHLLLPECLLDALLLHLDQVDPVEAAPVLRSTAEAARQPGVLVRLALAAGARNGAGAATLNLPQGGEGLLHGGGPRDGQADALQKS